MDAIGKLEAQHSDVVQRFRDYRAAREDQRTAMFDRLCAAITTYGELEERDFYPFARSRSTARLLPRFIDEQLRVKRHLSELKQVEPGAASFEGKLGDLERELDAHAREQSEQLYPLVRTQLGRLRLVELGEQMERATGKPDAEGALPH